MDRARLSSIAHTGRSIAAPLSSTSVDALVSKLCVPMGARVLDVGCGDGEWLARVVAAYPEVSAEGVDSSPFAVARARTRLAGSAEIHETTISAFGSHRGVYGAVLCVGSTHAFGGLEETLLGVYQLLGRQGVALVGEGFWERPPGDAALAGLGAGASDFTDLAGVIDRARRRGFAPYYAHVSSQSEWDEYEFTWVGNLERHAGQGSNDDAAELRAAAAEHLQGYLGGYRGTLGFVTLLLART